MAEKSGFPDELIRSEIAFAILLVINGMAKCVAVPTVFVPSTIFDPVLRRGATHAD